jgi:DtxR family Mn-dependent transcriptional regulator
MPERPERTLLSLPTGEAAQVSRVSDRDPEILRYLSSLGIKPGVELRLVEKGPFDGPLMLQVGDTAKVHALGVKVCAEIHVAVGPAVDSPAQEELGVDA